MILMLNKLVIIGSLLAIGPMLAGVQGVKRAAEEGTP